MKKDVEMKEETVNEEEVINPIECLLDKENNENIFLYDENDNPVEFEQVAVVPLNNQIYAILAPVEELEGVGEDEAIVFALDTNEEDDSDYLSIVTDEEVVDEVFSVYYKLLDEAKDDEE